MAEREARLLMISLTDDADSETIRAWRQRIPKGDASARARTLLSWAIRQDDSQTSLREVLAEIRSLRSHLASHPVMPREATPDSPTETGAITEAEQRLLDALFDV